jgi:hypothetical protein
VENLNGIVQIGFFFLTPLVVLFAIYTIFNFIHKKQNRLIIVWIFIPLLIALFTLRGVSQRYIVDFLPVWVILASWGFIKLCAYFKKIRVIVVIIMLIIPLSLSLLLIYYPLRYFYISNIFTNYSENGFVNGQTSGYGIDETVKFLENENKKRPIIVTYAQNSGNPESAMSILMTKKNIMNGYFEMKYLSGISPKAECIETQDGKPIFFVSRNQQIAGFDKFVKKVKTQKKPIGKETISIYEFISGCKSSVKVDPTFQN